MSASESSPLASNLQQSIEQLIAETVQRSQVSHEAEKQRIWAALQNALTEVEAGQAAMNRAAEILREALTEREGLDDTASSIVVMADESPAPAPIAVNDDTEENISISEEAAESGPHELNVIAHDVSIGVASGLQSLLRERPEVNNAQTREFVNGELRLKLDMASGLDMNVLNAWLKEHSGVISTSTNAVLELRFTS